MDEGTAVAEPTTTSAARRAARGMAPLDVVAAAVLGIAAAAQRRDLPDRGLAYDDAWVVVGARQGGFDDILTVSTNHPGFTLLLMVWSRLGSPASVTYAAPALIAGVLAAPVAYLVLTRLRVHRFPALAAASLLVIAPVHATFSGRIKPYTAETLLSIVALLVTPIVAGRRWRWRTTAIWTASALAIGTFSAFAAVIALTATLMVALHPRDDRSRRLVAVAVQVPVLAVQSLVVSSRYDAAQVAENWGRYGGYLDLDDPAGLPQQFLTHARRFGQTILPVGSGPATALVTVALAGLVWAAWRGGRRRSIAARLLLLQLAVAVAGALAHQIPFGPAPVNPFFPTGRAMLWLVPAVVGGLALGGDMAVRTVTARWGSGPARVLAAALLVGTLVIVVEHRPRTIYLDPGSVTTARFTDEALRDGDVLILLESATWPYAAEPSADAGIRSDPTTLQGFVPTFTRPRTFFTTSWDGSTDVLAHRVDGADRVVVLNGWIGLGEHLLPELEAALTTLGFAPIDEHSDGLFEATVWDRSD